MKLKIHVEERKGWITAAVEDFDGVRLGSATAPLVEGATFDFRAAVIRGALEKALNVLDSAEVNA